MSGGAGQNHLKRCPAPVSKLTVSTGQSDSLPPDKIPFQDVLTRGTSRINASTRSILTVWHRSKHLFPRSLNPTGSEVHHTVHEDFCPSGIGQKFLPRCPHTTDIEEQCFNKVNFDRLAPVKTPTRSLNPTGSEICMRTSKVRMPEGDVPPPCWTVKVACPSHPESPQGMW